MSGKSGLTVAEALVDHGGELAHGVGVRVGAGAVGLDLVELDRVSELHEGRGPQRHLVREREAHRHDARVRRLPPPARRARCERRRS